MAVFDDNQTKKMEQLVQILDKLKPNVVTVTELNRFKLLFTRPDPSSPPDSDQVHRLSVEFMTKFDLYKPIDVTDGNGNVLFVIPQHFLPISDVKKEYKALLNKFRQDGTSDIPKYASEANNCLLAAVFKSQIDDVKEKGYASFGEYVRAKSAEYAENVAGFKAYDSNTKAKVAESKVEPNIGDDDGYSWE